MIRLISRIFVVLTVLLTAAGSISAEEPGTVPGIFRVDFDDVAAGGLPEGWTVDATNPRGKPAPWKVAADASAPGGPNVLKALPSPDNFGGTYNLVWTPAPSFLDGEIEVRLRADRGHEDQGGGPMWRVKDADNYYIARYNPLEHNFRVYTVKDGARKMLDTAARLKVPAGQWFTIRIVQKGNHIEGWLDGKKLLDVVDDTFTEPGGVGLWTKADAATSFDDFVVRPAGR